MDLLLWCFYWPFFAPEKWLRFPLRLEEWIFQFDPFLPIPVVLYMLQLQGPNFAPCHFTVQLQHFDSNRWSKTGPKRITDSFLFFATESLRFDKIYLCFLKPLLLWLVSRFFFQMVRMIACHGESWRTCVTWRQVILTSHWEQHRYFAANPGLPSWRPNYWGACACVEIWDACSRTAVKGRWRCRMQMKMKT